MTRAKITRTSSYRCAPEGHTVETYPEGAVVSGRVAEWAIEDGAASRMFDPREETKPAAPVEPKAKRGRSRKKVG